MRSNNWGKYLELKPLRKWSETVVIYKEYFKHFGHFKMWTIFNNLRKCSISAHRRPNEHRLRSQQSVDLMTCSPCFSNLDTLQCMMGVTLDGSSEAFAHLNQAF